VSALGHYLEEEGIASVAIALARPQAENTRPPRALWVPFELGRPIGPPSDAAFQKRVILAALGLLEAKRQASLIVDFPDDDPREAPDVQWLPPSGAAHPHPNPRIKSGAGSPPQGGREPRSNRRTHPVKSPKEASCRQALLFLFPPPLRGRVREGGAAGTAFIMTNDSTITRHPLP
jgi:hypothetical protein